METITISITIYRIWFGFILLGCFFMSGISQNDKVYQNCEHAKHNVSLKSKDEYTKPWALCEDYACEFWFREYDLTVFWKFKLPTDVNDTSSFCTRGSLYSETYGELIHSSEVSQVFSEDKRVPIKKGKYVYAKLKYEINPKKKRYTKIASGKFKTEILLNCKKNETPLFCVWFPACIWVREGKEMNRFNCTVSKKW